MELALEQNLSAVLYPFYVHHFNKSTFLVLVHVLQGKKLILHSKHDKKDFNSYGSDNWLCSKIRSNELGLLRNLLVRMEYTAIC